MKVYFGSDRHGEELRPIVLSFVKGLGYDVEDLGMSIDFPLNAKEVALKITGEDRGVLICGSGHGMAIAANKFPGIRASVGIDPYHAKYAREHNDINVIAIGADYTDAEAAKETVKVFLETGFLAKDRYKRRIEQIASFEKSSEI